MRFKELKTMNKSDRQKKLDQARIELIKLNAKVSTGTPPKSPGQIKQLKKTIAKIKSIKEEEVVPQQNG